MRRAIVAGTFLALVAARGADAADDPGTTMRGDVDALLKALAGRPPIEGASPTVRVNRLLVAGDAKLRPLLEEAWSISTTWSAAKQWRPPLRRLVAFLYGTGDRGVELPDGEAEIFEVDGVVRVRRAEPSGGAGRGREDTATTFAEIVKGGTLRRPGRPDLKRAFAALDGGKVPEEERLAVAQAIGEASGASKPAVSDLLRRHESDPATPWVVTALGWSASPDAEAALRGRFAALAARVADSGADSAAALVTAGRALGHLSRDALVDEIGKLSGAPRDAALAAAGLDVAASIDLSVIARASDPASREQSLLALCARLRSRREGDVPSGAVATALVKVLASSLEIAAESLRGAVLDAAEEWLYASNRFPISNSSKMSGGEGMKSSVTGERVGPYPDMATVLASMAKDLGEGLLVFADGEPSVFELAGHAGPGDVRPLRSRVKCPDPTMTDVPEAERETVSLRGELIGPVLRLALKNEGAAPITVNPAALHVGVGEFTEQAVYGGPGGSRMYTNLKVQLGFVRSFVTSPAANLVTLAPGGEFGWGVMIRGEHREATHLSVELTGGFVVRGRPTAPLLAAFAETWVK